MKRSFLLLFMCVVASMAFSQTTGFMPLQFSTKMMDNTKYWENMHQLFMKGHQYRYVCITCPSFNKKRQIMRLGLQFVLE